MDTIRIQEIEEKSVVWFENSNQYIVLEKIVSSIIEKFFQNENKENIAKYLSNKIEIPELEAFSFVNDIDLQIIKPNLKVIEEKKVNTSFAIPEKFKFIKRYKINNQIIEVKFSNDFEVSLIHPKFAHLEIEESVKCDFRFEVFQNDEQTFLILDNEFIGSWVKEDIHYFQGKFSMKIIESIYKKEEEKWMGVFHASAINLKDKSILILGDSGNGKSTSLALLQSQGFNCIADDFVPIDIEKNVYSFPAGISIKPKALEVLYSLYPELKSSAEYYYKRLNKTVRYLPPKEINYHNKYPCKALVFIKYDSGIEFNLQQISSINAFEKLIPDSWISSISENVSIFLEWFSALPCYQITYSNNELMYDAIRTIFKDEL